MRFTCAEGIKDYHRGRRGLCRGRGRRGGETRQRGPDWRQREGKRKGTRGKKNKGIVEACGVFVCNCS